MKIAFVVHYFPPLNSTGARRVLALCKYLVQFGHQVIVLTTRKSKSDGPLTEELPKGVEVYEVLQRGIHDARARNYPAVSSGASRSLERSQTGVVLSNIKRTVMRTFGSIIDHRLAFVLDSIGADNWGKLRQLLVDVDVIVSSCPPWPVHLLAHVLARRLSIPWIADYRDQFSGNHSFPGNWLSAHIERLVDSYLLAAASAVCVVSGPMKEYYGRFHAKVETIENGYDEELVESLRTTPKSPATDKLVVIRHMGTITPDRLPTALFKALVLLPESKRNRVKVEFYGDALLAESLLRSSFPELLKTVQFLGSVPYKQSLSLMLDADALYLKETSDMGSASSKGVLTTKLFEYMSAKRPVIAETTRGSLIGQFVLESGLSQVCSLKSGEIAIGIQELLERKVSISPNSGFITRFSRRALSGRYEVLLQSVLALTK